MADQINRAPRRGHLTAEQLRSGIRDQYAVLRDRGSTLIKIELRHEGAGLSPWLVSFERRHHDAVSVTDAAFTTLDEARREFRRLVRKNP